MRNYLIFKKDGEILENKIKKHEFDITNFEFVKYKRYNNYILLFNDTEDETNITRFNFTEDKFKGDLGLVLVDDDNTSIKNLTINKYVNVLKKNTNVEYNEMYYSSDESDIEDIEDIIKSSVVLNVSPTF